MQLKTYNLSISDMKPTNLMRVMKLVHYFDERKHAIRYFCLMHKKKSRSIRYVACLRTTQRAMEGVS